MAMVLQQRVGTATFAGISPLAALCSFTCRLPSTGPSSWFRRTLQLWQQHTGSYALPRMMQIQGSVHAPGSVFQPCFRSALCATPDVFDMPSLDASWWPCNWHGHRAAAAYYLSISKKAVGSTLLAIRLRQLLVCLAKPSAAAPLAWSDST
jgi:hypothetical protein